MTPGPISSSLEDWSTRAELHPSPSAFTPTKDSLVLAVLLNAPVDTDGFTLALFEPDIAVDAMGRVLILRPTDFSGLSALARLCTSLPDTGFFRNTWRVNQPTTSQPTDRILVLGEDGVLEEIGVQGYVKGGTRVLMTRVGGFDELPVELAELDGLVKEGRAGFRRGEEDEGIIGGIRDILGDV
ncbi:hypothetical protein JAAARDRAFT_42802 [Jaapia argillacea MUCL 33604]|uniref:Uncharacterized protein n=1 Tax=Jaapia argillacea MUCL 33604 TaxID=933084 RepID=A0A067P3L7_9AGAM|nr:hypothetical protein JAAARDRAFT_42802 [Jaapia argillacea MUCL 33604]